MRIQDRSSPQSPPPTAAFRHKEPLTRDSDRPDARRLSRSVRRPPSQRSVFLDNARIAATASRTAALARHVDDFIDFESAQRRPIHLHTTDSSRHGAC
ncbi:hypothetical protein CCHR01_18695 [Colletotrichum chrysophilum]|uniref:Uncharacterized protein n=1 Tax=Colletotrichum chrysophilum TaxID=1836956 RepID=A0AAD9E8M9_9PEZI|nr:hypothetical protein CCHR01_18695 [Colletotrichum chrysophilum]